MLSTIAGFLNLAMMKQGRGKSDPADDEAGHHRIGLLQI